MAWEGTVGPAEEPAPSDTDEKDAAASNTVEDIDSSSSEETDEPQCSGSEDDNTDEETQETADTTDSTTQTTPTKTIPRVRLPILGRMHSKCLPFLAADIADLLVEGLTPVQMNVLGNFVTAVGSLILVVAAKAEVEEDHVLI